MFYHLPPSPTRPDLSVRGGLRLGVGGPTQHGGSPPAPRLNKPAGQKPYPSKRSLIEPTANHKFSAVVNYRQEHGRVA